MFLRIWKCIKLQKIYFSSLKDLGPVLKLNYLEPKIELYKCIQYDPK